MLAAVCRHCQGERAKGNGTMNLLHRIYALLQGCDPLVELALCGVVAWVIVPDAPVIVPDAPCLVFRPYALLVHTIPALLSPSHVHDRVSCSLAHSRSLHPTSPFVLPAPPARAHSKTRTPARREKLGARGESKHGAGGGPASRSGRRSCAQLPAAPCSVWKSREDRRGRAA